MASCQFPEYRIRVCYRIYHVQVPSKALKAKTMVKLNFVTIFNQILKKTYMSDIKTIVSHNLLKIIGNKISKNFMKDDYYNRSYEIIYEIIKIEIQYKQNKHKPQEQQLSIK